MLLLVFLLLNSALPHGVANIALYPEESLFRERRDLAGLWDFVKDDPNSNRGIEREWWRKDLSRLDNSTKMPVPSSFNDIVPSADFISHVGWVWYQTKFRIPRSWKRQRVLLRFESVHYFTSVWLNGRFITNHTSGRMVFGSEVTDLLRLEDNILTVAINNTLSHDTIPPADFLYFKGQGYPEGYFEQRLMFDFFNYAGIERKVSLYAVPRAYVSDVTTAVSIEGNTGILHYTVQTSGATNEKVRVHLLDSEGKSVANGSGNSNNLSVANVKLWWPRGGPERPGYLYRMRISLEKFNEVVDEYSLEIGFRSVAVANGSFLINGRPFYFKGFGMHEDGEIRGKGFDEVLMTKDLNMLEWMNANSFRTSHYPYSEEKMRECNRRGIVVILEAPAVSVRFFNAKTRALHERLIEEMIARDKNHAAVVMWSLSNEAWTHKPLAKEYFSYLINRTRVLDSTRPVTMVLNTDPKLEQTAEYLDVIGINRYYGWYRTLGNLDVIKPRLMADLREFHDLFPKPILVTEYGAGALLDLNQYPSIPFTTSYQGDLLSRHHETFDELRSEFLIGEMVWNFADFMTASAINRVAGNRKGVLTRNRQPKPAAFLIKDRYNGL